MRRLLGGFFGGLATLAAAAFLQPVWAGPTLFEGTLYYTHFAGGGDNVLKVGFSYDATTGTLTYGAQVGVASLAGADGIMFAPNGNLLVTSNVTDEVFRLNAATGALLQTVSTGSDGYADYHMALDPGGKKFYSSNYYNRDAGPLDTFTINADGSITSATTSAISGEDVNVTQLAFAPNGLVFYSLSKPNCCGSIGLFDLSTGATNNLVGGVRAAHGIVYDPFSGLMTLFGGGAVSTIDPTAVGDAAIAASLKSKSDITCDFDQGSVDGFGHAFIAGCGAMTFIDYSTSGDITSPDRVIVTSGFGDIDDIAPLVGLGAPPPVRMPEPGTTLLAALAALALARQRGLRHLSR